MTPDALASYVARSTQAMVLNMQDKQIFVIINENI